MRSSLFRRICKYLMASLSITSLYAISGSAWPEANINLPATVYLIAWHPRAKASSAKPARPLLHRKANISSSTIAQRRRAVVAKALRLVGTKYRLGGNTLKSGMDCSGFVKYVFQSTLGLTLPRRTIEMSRRGHRVSKSNLKPGDLVFFNTFGRTISHVGIYIGNNKFVHAPSAGKRVRVDKLTERYWKIHYTGARRIIMAAR